MLHISDIKKFNRCPRLYYLTLNEPSIYQPYLRHDEELTRLIVEYFKIDNYYVGQKGDDPNRIFKEINNYDWFYKVRFAYDDLRIKIPLMHKKDDGFDIYFVVFAPFPKAEDADFYRMNFWVLKNLNINIKNTYIIHLNSEYIRGDELNVEELFVLSDCLYKQNKPNIKIHDLLQDDMELDNIIYEMKNSSLFDFSPIKKRSCKGHNICAFYNTCFKEKLADNSIEFLVSSSNKKEMIKNGIKYLKDADLALLEGTKIQYAQIQADRNNGLFCDTLALNKWLAFLKNRKLAFIDFEWDTYLIPPYKGLKPYEHVPFQYSMHLLIDDDLKHFEFISKGDCRKDFIESMIKDIPSDALILAYNAKGAEMIRIEELIRQFPEYTSELNDILNRFIDMSYPFLEGLVYSTKMRGNFSVKSLLTVVSDMNYEDLDISSGMDAVYKWRLLDREDENIDQEDLKNKLSEYCSLDSYSLYLIYRWLVNLIN